MGSTRNLGESEIGPKLAKSKAPEGVFN